ncbi:MAG: sugar phosphate isomerase/epimerase family protein [Methanosarcinaceae archaeon]
MTRIGGALDLRFGKNTLQFLDFLHSNGFSHIEIKKDNDYVYGEIDPAKLERILSEYDITISYHAPHNEFNIASVNEKVRMSCVSQIIEMGEYLQMVGSGWVNIHIGYVSGAYHKTVIAKAEENLARSLDEIAAVYETLDTGIYVENDSFEKNIIKFGLQPEQVRDILNRYPGFGATFDIGHAHHSGIPPLHFTELLGNRINAVHLHDNNGVSDEHLALGKGTLDLSSGLVKEIDRCLSSCNGHCSTYVFEMKMLPDFVSSKEYFSLL